MTNPQKTSASAEDMKECAMTISETKTSTQAVISDESVKTTANVIAACLLGQPKEEDVVEVEAHIRALLAQSDIGMRAEAAASAAMAEGNKHGVKSFIAAKIVAAYLNASAQPIEQQSGAKDDTDQYINELVQQYGYSHPIAIAARLEQWIGRYGRQDAGTLAMSEAMRALRQLASQQPHPVISQQGDATADVARYRKLTKAAHFTATSSPYQAGKTIIEFPTFECQHDFENDWCGERFERSVDAAVDAWQPDLADPKVKS